MGSTPADLNDSEFIDIYGRPYDRWIVSYPTSNERIYLSHLASPRFVAKVTHEPRRVATGGLSIQAGDTTFYDILFFDPAPADPGAMRDLFSAAARVFRELQQQR